MRKEIYVKPQMTVCAMAPMAILAGSGTTGVIKGPDTVTSGDDEDVWE